MDCGHARYELDGGVMRDGDVLRVVAGEEVYMYMDRQWSGVYRHLARLD
jgi:hypothetical protein